MLRLDIPEAFFDFTTISTDVSLEVNVRFDVEFEFHVPVCLPRSLDPRCILTYVVWLPARVGKRQKGTSVDVR